jgi:hypothetical protein
MLEHTKKKRAKHRGTEDTEKKRKNWDAEERRRKWSSEKAGRGKSSGVKAASRRMHLDNGNREIA